MKLALIISALLIATVFTCPFHGGDYQKKSATEKQDCMMKELNNHPDAGGFYTIRMPQLFIQDNKLSFTHDGDDMPKQGLFNLETRPKLIHTVGLTAECEFVSNGNHSYSGIFKGAKSGIVRFSAAKDTGKDDFRPGFTFKLYRDGVKSANIISMYNLLGQQTNTNPFLHDQTNHVPFFNQEEASFLNKQLLGAFKKVSDWPTFLGLSDAAKFDQFGNEEKEINFPFRIIFHPTKAAREQIPNDLKMGESKKPFYISAMQDLKVDTLFEVYVQKTPMSDDVEKIGEIKQKTPFKASDFGDYSMYYQHQLFEEDIAYHPEWVAPAKEIIKKEEAFKPHFERADLPFEN